ncbi:227_t:CDS:2 [Acaulospora morrowiae]|uniref:Adenylyl cyclase-associated protein n=1 Tax=Acaulospora morrowiae TaxID=94023 RepID=A0A9N9DWX0_9GLOM|nr:227_t:CDS:2 [Acaulospora morrowiae]
MTEFQSLTTLIKRLEAATSRLEDLATSNVSNVSANNFVSPTNIAAVSKTEPPVLEAYDELIEGPLKNFLELSKTIGGLVLDQSHSVEDIFTAQRDFIHIATESKKPEVPNTIIELIRPTQQALEKGIGALGWVTIEQKPGPYVGDLKDSSQFYANRVITEFKDKDRTHVDWANSFVFLLAELQNYVKKFHTTGLTWNPKGVDPDTFIVIDYDLSGQGKSVDMSSVFAEINRGEGITSTLRKVDKSQMTHKNPSLRESSVVSDVGAKAQKKGPAAPPKPASLSLKKQPKKTLEGNKWKIENFENDTNIVVENTAINHAVYIYGCKNSTIQIKGKINTITLVSTVDIVDCKSFQLQIQGKTPIIVVDKSDIGNIYLSEECLDVEILTSKSSSINVNLPGLSEDGDYVERPIPEQLKSKIVDGKINSVPMEFMD